VEEENMAEPAKRTGTLRGLPGMAFLGKPKKSDECHTNESEGDPAKELHALRVRRTLRRIPFSLIRLTPFA